jgi:hypothetical protein
MRKRVSAMIFLDYGGVISGGMMVSVSVCALMLIFYRVHFTGSVVCV